MAYLEVKNLTFSYDGSNVLKNVGFHASKGELIAIVGPSGCGKTTLLRLIVGILQPIKGSIILDNEDITTKPIEYREVGYVPQNQSLFPHMSVFDNITFGLKSNHSKRELNHVFEIIKISGLEGLLSRKPHELSGGQKQRVALLRAIAPLPKLLLLDEPLSNVDSHLREKLALFIRVIQLNSDVTTLFITHDLDEAKMLADRLILMKDGKILQIGTPREVTLVPKSIETANVLGLKNVFQISNRLPNKESSVVTLNIDIGSLEIPLSKLPENVKGVYIDPTQIKISSRKINGNNSFTGRILAIIPNLTTHQSTVIVQVEHNRCKDSVKVTPTDSNNRQINHVIHIQIPNNELSYCLNDLVRVSIPFDSLFFL